jgi:hypothetical protein
LIRYLPPKDEAASIHFCPPDILVFSVESVGNSDTVSSELELSEEKYQSHSAIKAVFSSSKIHYAKRKFPVTSNLRYIYGVLNVDEIKN